MDHDPHPNSDPNSDPNGDPNSDPTSDPTSDKERRVASRLSARARQVDVIATPIEVVMQRGRERSRQQRTATSLLVVLAVCGGTIGAAQVLSRPGNPGTVTSSPNPDSPTAASAPDSPELIPAIEFAPITVVEPNLVWNRVDPASPEAMISSFGAPVVGTGPFLTWSTSPGLSNVPEPAIWRSGDGLEWELAATAPEVAPGLLAGFDGQFFTYGTTPATAPVPGNRFDLGVATSNDLGDTWATARLPIDVSELAAADGVGSVSLEATAIAAGPQGVVVAARARPLLNLAELLPAEVLGSNFLMTAAGIQVFAESPCGPTTAPTTPGVFADQQLAEFAELLRLNGLAVGGTTISTLSMPPATTVAPVATDAPTSTVVDDGTGTIPASTDAFPVGTTPMSTFPATTINFATPPPATGPSDWSDTADCAPDVGPLPVADELTWEELGVDPDVARASLVPQMRFFLSTDSTTFAEVASPPLGTGQAIADLRLAMVDGRFVAWVASGGPDGQTIGPPRLFDSSDGRTWTDVGASPAMVPDSIGALDGRLVLAGYSDAARVAAVSVRQDDETWSTVNLNDLTVVADGVKPSFQMWSGATFGQFGITTLATLVRDPIAEFGGVELTKDGVTISADNDVGAFRFVDVATQTEIGTTHEWTSSNPLIELSATGSFVVSKVEGGPVITAFSSDEINQMMQPVYAAAGYAEPEVFLLHSADGVTWSRQGLDEIVGERTTISQGSVTQTSTQVVVSARIAGTEPSGPATKLLVVGTPRT